MAAHHEARCWSDGLDEVFYLHLSVISEDLHTKHLLVPKKLHQTKDFEGRRSLSWTSHLTAFDLQLGSNSASPQ